MIVAASYPGLTCPTSSAHDAQKVKVWLGFGLVCVAAGLSLGAQQPVFRSGVDSVAIWVTVNGPDGRLVLDLAAGRDAGAVRFEPG